MGATTVSGVGNRLITPHKPACYEMLHRISGWVASCGHGNEPLGSVKGRELLD